MAPGFAVVHRTLKINTLIHQPGAVTRATHTHSGQSFKPVLTAAFTLTLLDGVRSVSEREREFELNWNGLGVHSVCYLLKYNLLVSSIQITSPTKEQIGNT